MDIVSRKVVSWLVDYWLQLLLNLTPSKVEGIIYLKLPCVSFPIYARKNPVYRNTIFWHDRTQMSKNSTFKINKNVLASFDTITIMQWRGLPVECWKSNIQNWLWDAVVDWIFLDFRIYQFHGWNVWWIWHLVSLHHVDTHPEINNFKRCRESSCYVYFRVIWIIRSSCKINPELLFCDTSPWARSLIN